MLRAVDAACAEVGVRVLCAYEVTDRHGPGGAKAGLAEPGEREPHGQRQQ